MANPLASTVAPSRARYGVIAFAIVLAIIQYIDRVCISTSAPYITQELGLTAKQMGYVFSAFTLAYALFEIPCGYLGDRIGPRRVLVRIVLWWSAFTALTGAAFSYVSMLVVRFLFGAGEAGCFPNITKAFKRWLPPNERTWAQSLTWMSTRWGGALTPPLVFFCVQHMNWRMTFVVFGLLGVIWAIVFARWYRDDPRTHSGVNAAEAALLPTESEGSSQHFRMPWSKLVRSKSVWCLCGQYFALSYVWTFFVTWFPTYLLKARGFNLKESAWLAGTPLLLGGFGSLAAGWLLPRLSERLGGIGLARRSVGAAALVVGAVLLVVSTGVINPYLAVAFIALASFCNDLTMPGAWTSCMDVGGRYVATVSGTMNMMGNLGGFLSPIIVGNIVDNTGNWALSFYAGAAVYILGAICWVFMDPVTPLEQAVRT